MNMKTFVRSPCLRCYLQTGVPRWYATVASDTRRFIHSTVTSNSSPRSASAVRKAIAISAGVAGFFGWMIWKSTGVLAEAPGDSNMKLIRLAEVKKHGHGAETVWVTRGNRVYDITDWIQGHPGGDVILRAAGSSIEPYWKIFTIHQKQDVYDILEQYFIGLV